ncbi:MAG: hypothetical protein WC628_05765 [Candidatus Omnitrophota bacterium]
MQKNSFAPERRSYIRLDSIFPVQFCLFAEGRGNLSEWQQGYTCDVGKGGICLTVNNLEPRLAGLLLQQQATLALEIEIPLGEQPVRALAKVSWVKDVPGCARKFSIGLNYEKIDPLSNARIMRYARMKKIFPRVALSAIVLLGLGFGLNSYFNFRLMKSNRGLVNGLVELVQESSVAKQKIKIISKERMDLQIKIQAQELRIRSIEEEMANTQEEKNKIAELNTQIAQLSKEKDTLREQLISVQHKESAVAEELLHLDQHRAVLEKENFDKMYQWLKNHQHSRTGLVMSFEGDSDVANWSFTYDQALAAIAFVEFSEISRARKLFSFLKDKAERKDGYFYNAYFCQDGSPAEYTVHCGPNIWLGIAILQYMKKSSDNTYLNLAEEIARNIIALQDRDLDGGIRGGPNIAWYSTEHNLDAYAFFNMLYKLTAKPQYQQAADKTLTWLVNNIYNNNEFPVKRGKGDSTIATDTYAWSISAIGPEKLLQLNMNPDRILEFAEANCAAEVDYTRPGGQVVKVKGFDFATQRNLARGKIVSTEWTAQMVLAFKIMSEYYHKLAMIAKARAYALKADEYLVSLTKMIISSPSPSGQGESCLPYATQDFVDTGHGWYTPKGKSTGSVAATAHAIFAYYNYNPLELKE